MDFRYEKRYDLITKLAICKRMGIDYLNSGFNIPYEIQKKNIESIILKIARNPHLVEQLDNIDDEFWDKASKNGLLIYTEMCKISNNEDENIETRKRYCKNESFITASGKIIEIKDTMEMPVLAYQKKKIIELNKIY